MSESGFRNAMPSILLAFMLSFVTIASATTPISQATYNNLVRFATFSSAAYLSNYGSCNTVTENLIFATYDDVNTNTYVYIALDTTNHQIIVAFRGTVITSFSNLLSDANIELDSYGLLSGCFGMCLVHDGFYSAWNAVKSTVVADVTYLHNLYPSYTVIATGHSLGGAIALFAAVQFNSMGYTTQAYTYGQPRVGSGLFNTEFDKAMSGKFFRVTRVSDGIPMDPPTAVFEQTQTEFYQQNDATSLATTVQCSGNTDSNCNSGHASVGYVAEAHSYYLGITMGSVC